MHYFKYLGSKESARQLWENEESLNKYLKRLRELMCDKINELTPVYVELMPNELKPGKLYISRTYSLARHLCACGCGGDTVTPLGAGEWSLSESNGKVTLRPSIGNFMGESPYHAHYYITDNKIEWL
jgi:hypothetical protein